MRRITTDGALIAAASSAHRGLATLPPTSPRSGSSAGPSSAASSTNTSGPHRSPGQGRWPSSETPQVHSGVLLAITGRHDPGRTRIPPEGFTPVYEGVGVIDDVGPGIDPNRGLFLVRG